MKIRLRIVASVLAVLAVLLASGCAGSEISTTSGDTQPSEVFDTSAPPGEGDETTGGDGGSGPTEPDVVTVDLPSLPVGGADLLSLDTPQCVSVAWNDLGDIPDGLVFLITGVAFTSTSFAVADESCSEPCLSSGFQPTTDSTCLVPVVWTGGDTSAAMTVVAEATCPPEQMEACEAFSDALTAGSFELTASPGEVDPSEETSPTDETSPDGSTESPDGGG